MARRFEKILDLATDQTLVEPNWEGILECVDMVRGGDVPVKDSLKLIQKRYHNSNPHVAHHALLVLEACVKNCGKKFHNEVATKENMDDLKNLLISSPPDNVKEKILELVQCWSSAFRNNPEYKIFGDTHNLLKMNGFEFPTISEAQAMFLADSAPDWADGENCYRCRVEFGMLTRKHHCRACGQIFCDKCSSRQAPLPQLGIEKKVRVCETCYEKQQNKLASLPKDTQGQPKINSESSAQAQKEAEEKEQEDLLLAIALSKSEAEDQERRRNIYQYNNSTSKKDFDEINKEYHYFDTLPSSNTTYVDENLSQMDNPNDDQAFDPELAKYLDRDYWERKKQEEITQASKASAPPPSEISVSVSSSASQRIPPINAEIYDNDRMMNDSTPLTLQEFITSQNSVNIQKPTTLNAMQFPEFNTHTQPQRKPDEVCVDVSQDNTATDTSKFCDFLKERINIMSTRMRSNKHRGRSIVNDTAIHNLFSQLTELHTNVLDRMNKLESDRAYYEGLQDRLAQIHETRQAITELRVDHERQREERIREEQRLRQQKLHQALGMMRHKKHEMLLTERDAALQRLQNYEMQIQQQRLLQQQTLAAGQIPQQFDPNFMARLQPNMFPPQQIPIENSFMQHGGHQLPVPMGSQLQNHPPPAPTTQIESNISASTGRLSQTTTAPLTSKSVSQAQAMAMSQSQQMPVHGSMWMPAYGQHAATVPPYGPGMVPTDMAQSMSTAQYPIPAHPMAYPGMMGMYTPHHFGLPQHQIPYQTPQQSSSVQVDQRQSQQPASEEKEDLLISFD